jgi:hypothetical protein
MCAQCKMAISERRYAAEIAGVDEDVIKFDNIDCMVRYAAANGLREEAAGMKSRTSSARKLCWRSLLRPPPGSAFFKPEMNFATRRSVIFQPPAEWASKRPLFSASG